MALTIDHITKHFGNFTAVDDVAFTVTPGRIFGFLGTNGAGKTTTMRMVLDIIRPDKGSITWNGMPNTDVPRREFGYLPEERGLYPKMPVDDQLLFLAQLYGASKQQAAKELDEWLERLEVTENKHKRVEQLSKGNQQKIQFLAAILHDPEILILDEPFSGLDPVNAEQMKQAFLTMKDRGKTIIFSTHQLDDAQELCHDVAIIHRGHLVISGDVPSVRQSAGQQIVRLAIDGDSQVAWLDQMERVQVLRRREDFVEMSVPSEQEARAVLSEAMRRELPVTRFEISYPSLNDIFLGAVRKLPFQEQQIPAVREFAPEPIVV
ncbi:MAG TPA: ATP-binding cassette domain-containing protein [Thermomicrobiales bacterium]|nr:ATP-binding cassette domain-containing protein [Thermomicrobiales bacterium]